MAAAVLPLALTACGGGSEEAADPSPTPSPSVSVQGSPSPAQNAAEGDEDETAVEAVVEEYWKIYIRSQNEVITDPDQFDGVAEGPFVEAHIKAVQNYKEHGNHRVGQPAIGPPTIAVTGDEATAVQCVDVAEWGVEVPDGSVQYPPGEGSSRSRAHLERRGADWIIVKFDDRGSLRC